MAVSCPLNCWIKSHPDDDEVLLLLSESWYTDMEVSKEYLKHVGCWKLHIFPNYIWDFSLILKITKGSQSLPHIYFSVPLCVLQGFMEQTPIFYGFYTNHSLGSECLNTALLFFFGMLILLLLNLIMIVRRSEHFITTSFFYWEYLYDNFIRRQR